MPLTPIERAFEALVREVRDVFLANGESYMSLALRARGELDKLEVSYHVSNDDHMKEAHGATVQAALDEFSHRMDYQKVNPPTTVTRVR